MARLLDKALEATGAKLGASITGTYSGRPSPCRHGEKDTQELLTTDDALAVLAEELEQAEKEGRAMSTATAKSNRNWGQW